MATLAELRRRFQATPKCQIVSADVYLQRLTGRERLVRADEPSANLLGLLNESTGSRILVPMEEFVQQQRAIRR